MINHYFRSAYRSFLRHKSTFIINFLSLTIGLACTIFIFLWVNDELQVDKFHANDSQLFQVMKHSQYAEGMTTKFHTMGPLAATIKADLPEVEKAATVVYWFEEFNLSVDEKNVTAAAYYAGKDFLDMFSFDLQGGTSQEVFKDLNNVALSRDLAAKLFGNVDNAIGQTVEFNRTETLKVTGLFTVPPVSTQQFDFVLSFEKFKQDPRFGPRMESWNSHGPKTFVQLQKNANIQQVATKINQIIDERADADHITFFLKPFSEYYLYAQYEEGQLTGGRIRYVQLFGMIGLFILAIACINFINLATARASLRAKEVSIKKMMGARRSSLIAQYLAEAALITTFALVTALAIVQFFITNFNTLTGKSIGLSFSPMWILSGVGLIAITSLLAGTYPAFYLSAIQPLKGIKGFLTTSWQELFIRKGLVVFQFCVSILLIISVLIISQQMDYLQNKNLGYDRSHLVSFLMNIPDRSKINAFVKEARQLPGVENISSGNSPVNHRNSSTNVHWEGKNPEDQISFFMFNTAEGMIETVGLQFKEGRSFSKDFGNEVDKVILNEKAVATMGLSEPIGKTIRLGEHENLQIIGIVNDFHFQSLHTAIDPMLILYVDQQIPMLMARIETGKEKTALADLQHLYGKFNPGVAFNYDFLDNQYASLYHSEQRVTTLSQLFSGFAIFISCLGLLGLIAFTAIQKRKEIGIRKVLGASIPNIVGLLSKDFIQLVIIALIIAVPVAWYSLSQ